MFDGTAERPLKPDTFKFCSCCNEYVLRSQWLDHEHHHREATGERFYADHDGSNTTSETLDGAQQTLRQRQTVWSDF